MSETKTWTPSEVRELSLSGAKVLREQVLGQIASESRSARLAAKQLLPIVDVHIASFGPQAVARRTSEARQFLGLEESHDHERERWERAVALCGSEASARQRGYRPPGEST